MAKRRHGNCIFLLILFTFNINDTKTLRLNIPSNPKDLLTNVMDNEANSPVVIIVDTHTNDKISDLDDLDDQISSGDDGILPDDPFDVDTKEDAKYLLYHLLRTTESEREPDSSLEETKQTLRQALRSRCRKVENCVKKCPKKKPSCPMNCQETFDNLDLCDPPKPKPKKCKEPRCGKTMPPKWRF